MKQLKFMLAAATAIGLATVVQADEAQGSVLSTSSTNFESYNIDAFPDDNSDWESTDPTSNFSEIVNDTSMLSLAPTKYTKKYGSNANDHTKSLSVDTGLGSLLRYLDKSQGAPVPVENVYIDTMVQFTVTPDGAEPTPTEEDKLILFAKEVDNTVKLHVISSMYRYDSLSGVNHNVVTTKTSSVVHKDMWYRLTIKSSTYTTTATTEPNKVNVFEIYIDGALVEASLYLLAGEFIGDFSESYTLFPSIQGATNEAGVKAVGFSGEGKVDDLVFTTEYPFEASPVDFTLALGEGVSAVSYTVGGVTGSLPDGNGAISVALNGISVTLSGIEYVPGYEAGNITAKSYQAEDITVDANRKAIVTDGGQLTTGADIGFTGTPFADFTGANLETVVAWAGTGRVPSATVQKMRFNDTGDPAGTVGSPERIAEEAYLLGCSPAEVEDKKEAFEFEAFDPKNPPTEEEFADKGYNGKVVIEGATTLSDEITGNPNWATTHENPAFYRARLIFK